MVGDRNRNIAPAAKWLLNKRFWIKVKQTNEKKNRAEPNNKKTQNPRTIQLNDNIVLPFQMRKLRFRNLLGQEEHSVFLSFKLQISLTPLPLEVTAAIQSLLVDWMTYWPLGRRGWWYLNGTVILQEETWGFIHICPIHRTEFPTLYKKVEVSYLSKKLTWNFSGLFWLRPLENSINTQNVLVFFFLLVTIIFERVKHVFVWQCRWWFCFILIGKSNVDSTFCCLYVH